MKKQKRSYVLRARGDKMAETRARIVEAMVSLHQEVGPSRTTVSAIAERAGVERLTVYRHFRDETEMLAACSHRYFELNPPPDPGGWADELDPLKRAKRGLTEIYAFFSRTALMFAQVYRDVGQNQAVTELMSGFDAQQRQVADMLAGAGKRRQLTLRHAIKFATWQSLESEGLDDAKKVALVLDWLAD